MSVRTVASLVVACSAALLVAAKVPHELSSAKALPDALAKDVAAQIQPEGYQVAGPKGAVCSIWLAKSIDVKPGFKSSLNVKYPFTNGQLMGALQIGDKAKFTDFRGQEMKPGVYTLRYGRQPEDGNHIGTSELSDFLVAIPAKDDTDPKTIAAFPTLAKMSAKASGTTHPAIFSLLPSEKPAAKATLDHDADHDYWVLNVTTPGKSDKTDVPVSIRLVVVGVSAG